VPKPVTQLLFEWREGDSAARDKLFSLLYGELKQLARGQMGRERIGHTLQPTALVHELYMRLAAQSGVQWQDRAHFFGIAARVLRQILVDHARTTQSLKRGGDSVRISLDEAISNLAPRDVDLVLLDDALIKLAQHDPRQCEIVELRFFGGLSIEETAEVTGLSPATVKRDWTIARAWLFREVGGASDDR
jgi:RNA polymerase sigma factor (TIGR02999 family)